MKICHYHILNPTNCVVESEFNWPCKGLFYGRTLMHNISCSNLIMVVASLGTIKDGSSHVGTI